MKLLLENEEGQQYEVEISSLKEAQEVWKETYAFWGSSDFQYPETGRITLDDGTYYYLSYNGQIWNGKYWESKKGFCYNPDVKKVEVV